MKKILITSVCTLVLSLLGAFGADQNSINLSKANLDTNTTQVVENVNDKNTNEKQSDSNQVTSAAETAAADKAVYKNTDTVVPQVKAATVVNSIKSTKGKASLVYKKVDLSKCKSKKEVVNTLQKHGYKNITAKNIMNNKALKQIITVIQKENCITGSAAVPTKAPVVTAKPSPTKAPAVTAKPSPTKAPAVTAKPSPTKTPAPSTEASGYASEVLRLVNVERAKAGLSALTTNQTLSSAANKRAQEIAVSFSHTRPSGAGFSSVLKDYGISFMAAGENIAYGQKTPQEVVTGWMNSPGHRANILNTKFHKLGIGVYQKAGVYYWTQLFTD